MHIITEITNPAERAAAQDYLESHERSAATFAAQFPADALVKLGPVQAREGGAMFESRGISDGTLLVLVIPVAPGMPEMDVWCTWAMALEDAGLRVRADAAYQAACSAMAEWEAEHFACR